MQTEGLKAITGSWQQRVWEAQMFADPVVHAFFEREGILFTNWKEMMHASTRRNRRPRPVAECLQALTDFGVKEGRSSHDGRRQSEIRNGFVEAGGRPRGCHGPRRSTREFGR